MEAGEVVAHLSIHGLDGRSELFGLQKQRGRDNFAIDFPAIRCHGEGPQMRYARPESLEGFVATTAHFHGKNASCGARHSNP